MYQDKVLVCRIAEESLCSQQVNRNFTRRRGSRTNQQDVKSVGTREKLCKEEKEDKPKDVNFTMQCAALVGKRQRFRSDPETTDPYTAVIVSPR